MMCVLQVIVDLYCFYIPTMFRYLMKTCCSLTYTQHSPYVTVLFRVVASMHQGTRLSQPVAGSNESLDHSS